MKSKSMSIIGSGNVASHLANAFFHQDFEIISVYARSLDKLAFCDQLSIEKNVLDYSVPIEGDVIFLCVSDDSIKTVASNIKIDAHQIVVHCSGGVNLDVLREINSQCGVFYPLQSFSKNTFVNIKSVPICVEGNTREIENELAKIANAVSNRVVSLNSYDRAKLHLAAVMVNNYVNFLIGKVQEYSTKENLDFTLLEPLINETILKALSSDALKKQTGPAKRGDVDVLSQELKMLSGYPELQKIADVFNQEILHYYEMDR